MRSRTADTEGSHQEGEDLTDPHERARVLRGRLEHAFALRSEELKAAAYERALLRRRIRELEQAGDPGAEPAAGDDSEALELRLLDRTQEVEWNAAERRRVLAVLKDLDAELEQALGLISAARHSTSWRLGHAIARWLRRITFRRPVGSGALEEAVTAIGRVRKRLDEPALAEPSRLRAFPLPLAEIERRTRDEVVRQMQQLEDDARPVPRDTREILVASQGSARGRDGSEPSADVIVCVKDAQEDLHRCLLALLHRTGRPFRLIVVDDGSSPETAQFLLDFRRANPAVTLLVNEQGPHGYGVAANIGLRASGADYVVLLNSDTRVTRGWLERIVECGESDPKIGIIGPLSNAASHQSVPEKRDRGGWAVNQVPPWLGEEGVALLVSASAEQRFPRVRFVNGFCYVIKREVIDEIGHFDDTRFSSYSEENDYSVRAEKAGFRLALANDAYVFHAKSRSYGETARGRLSKEAYNRLLEKHGAEEVAERVRSIEEDQALEPQRQALRDATASESAFRRRFAALTGDPLSVLFVLPGLSPGGSGGAHSVYQEVSALASLGARAKIALPETKLSLAEATYPGAGELFVPFADQAALVSLGVEFDAVVATHHDSAGAVKEISERNPAVRPGYYVQDYEPLFAPRDSAASWRARQSYEAIPDQLMFAKTGWLCSIVFRAHGVHVEKVEPSLDRELFHPRGRSPRGARLKVAAMVRPRTPRRQALLTSHVLTRAQRTGAMEIHTFGCEQEALERITGGSTPFQHHGLLRRDEVGELLRSSDVFLDASLYQAFGRTGLEAMACGCVPVLPRLGGVGEFATDDESALLVDTTSPEGPLEALGRLAADEALLARLGENGVERSKRYSLLRAALSEYSLLSDAARERRYTGPTRTDGASSEDAPRRAAPRPVGDRGGEGHEGGYRAYSFAGGRIYLDASESSMMRARIAGTYEPEKVRFIERNAGPGMTFVDIGANKGDFSLIAARAIGPTGRVIAFEPEPSNCHWIRRSVALNGYPNVEVRELALAEGEGSALLHLGKRSGWHSIIPTGKSTGEAIEVPISTLDKALAQSGARRVDIIKLDVEGAELSVLKGGKRTLTENDSLVVLMDLHPGGVDPRQVCELLLEWGFSLRDPGDPTKAISPKPSLTEVFAIRGDR